MNVHHLELFYYVAKYEGITSAVRKMPYGIQQPAVSGQLLQLEKSLGVKLFNRRPFSLTTAGDELYDHVYPFFSRLGDVEQRLKGEESKHLRIAASASVLRHHLPELLADMRDSMPELRLTLRNVEPSDVQEVLVRQQADLAVSVIHSRMSEGINAIELLSLPLALMVPKKHQAKKLEDLLEDNNGVVTPKLPLVGLPSYEEISQIFLKEVDRRRMHWPVAVEVDSLDAVKHFVSCDFGTGITVRIPGVDIPKGMKLIDLEGFPPLVIGILHQGGLKPIAKKFLTAAEQLAGKLIGSK